MKQIIAIIRMNKVNATKSALIDAGFPAFTVRKVVGRGEASVDPNVIQGAGEGVPEAIARLKDDGPMLLPKRMMTFVVDDAAVSKLIHTLIEVNKTGQKGDGKILVLPLLEAIRIRTGETGVAALI